MPAGFLALAVGAAARAASPQDLSSTGPTVDVGDVAARYVGARAGVSGGVDAWSGGGGGPAVIGQLALGGSWSRGPWTRAARIGSWVEGLPGGVFDGHVGALQLRHQSGLGGVLVAVGSASVGWGQGSVLGSADATVGPVNLSGAVGPAVRAGVGGGGAGGSAVIGIGIARGPVRPGVEARGTLWGVGGLSDLGQVAAWVRALPGLGLEITPSASVLATGSGTTLPTAGLPAGDSRVARAGLMLEQALGRTLRLQADGAYEVGPGYRRVVGFAGLAAQLGRIRSRGCGAIAAGTVVFRLEEDQAEQVAVSGTFTGWAPVPMAREGDGWRVALPLGVGAHEYVYLVDGAPVVPPEAALTRPDGWGGTNGVLEVRATPCE